MMTRLSQRLCSVVIILAASLFAGSPLAFDLPDSLLLPRPGEQKSVSKPADTEKTVPAPEDPIPADTLEKNEDQAKTETQTVVNGSLTLKDAGITDGLTIDGHQPQSGFTFTLPNDRVIVNAELLLTIHASSALVEGQHYLNVMLNGQPLAQLPLNQVDEDNATFSLDIPAPMLVSINNISVTLENGKTLQCEKDSEKRYQLTIQPDSRIDYQGIRLNTVPDLSRFPWPFIDPLEMGRQQVAMVFSRKPTADVLDAGSIISTFLGYHADYKGINLPVSLGELPQSNAIIIAHPGDTIGSLKIVDEKRASLQIIDNPQYPIYKLLIVSGKNGDALKNAAYALTHNSLPEAANLVGVASQHIPKRQAYDADRWVDTHHPVPFSKLIAQNSRLNVEGLSHEAIRIAFRTAPDLFMWDGDAVPVKLNYHFPTHRWIDEDKSALGISLNGRFLRNVSVNSTGLLEKLWHKVGGDTRQEQQTLRIQPWQIYGDNQFEFYFAVKANEEAPCQVFNDNSIKSSIDPTSTLDLSHTWHFSELPNLSYFVGAGFPYSRLADLSQTVVLMAEHPGATEINTLLSLMARQGNATGVTAHGVHIILGESILKQESDSLEHNDVLVVASLTQHTFMSALFAKSPYDYNDGMIDIRPMNYLQKVKIYLQGNWLQQNTEVSRYLNSATDWRGFVSFKSPWAPKRSVILATATQDEQLALLADDLRNPKINAAIKGDIAVIGKSDGVHSWHIGTHYVSGQMPWYLQIFWYASQHFLVLGLLCSGLAVLLGLALYFYLHNQSRMRLKNYIGQQQNNDGK